jgi:hypothetical protein
MYLDVIIADKDDQVYDAYTNNPYKSYWTSTDGQQIQVFKNFSVLPEFSYDEESGAIYLPYNVALDDRVYVNAFYQEKYLHYTDLELNPVFNPGIIDKQVILYMRPQHILDRTVELDDPINDRGLYHFIVDNTGRIIDYPQDDDGLPLDPDLLDSGDQNYISYFRKYQANIIVANVFVGRYAAPTEITAIDIRQRGGGIKDDVDRNQLVADYPEAMWFADIGYWDGRPYPGSMAVLINIPFSVTEDGGGQYSHKEVEGVVKKHLMLGTYPIIRYYDETTRLYKGYAAISGSNTTITLYWTAVTDADSYNIYTVTNRNTYTLVGSATGVSTSFTITSTTDNMYHICIAPVIDSEERRKSNILALMGG